MDRGTKIYAIVLGTLCLALAITFLYESPKISKLNKQLKSIEEIKNFTYQFRVVRINNRVAIMSSPRSTAVPVSQVLGILFPEVKGKTTQSPEFQKAQKSLATVQTLARNTVLSDKEIEQVKWELDRSWLIQKGVTLK